MAEGSRQRPATLCPDRAWRPGRVQRVIRSSQPCSSTVVACSTASRNADPALRGASSRSALDRGPSPSPACRSVHFPALNPGNRRRRPIRHVFERPAPLPVRGSRAVHHFRPSMRETAVHGTELRAAGALCASVGGRFLAGCPGWRGRAVRWAPSPAQPARPGAPVASAARTRTHRGRRQHARDDASARPARDRARSDTGTGTPDSRRRRPRSAPDPNHGGPPQWRR